MYWFPLHPVPPTYINTVKGVGENGRGGGQVTSAIKLPVGQWHTIWVEKTADQLCIIVDILHRTCANRTVPVEDFRMKTPGSISYPVGVNMESRNFLQLPYDACGDGAGGAGASGDGAGGDGASGDGAGGDGAGGDGARGAGANQAQCRPAGISGYPEMT